MVGRNTQGVRLIRTVENEHVVGLQRIEEVVEELLELDEDGNPIAIEEPIEQEENAAQDGDSSTTEE